MRPRVQGSRPRPARLALALALAALAPLAPGPAALAAPAPARAAQDAPDRWTLYRGLLEAERVAVQGRLEERLAARVAQALELLAETTRFTGRVLAAGEAPDADEVRVVLGTPDDEDVLALAAPLGVTRGPQGGFRLRGRLYDLPGDALVATFADPERPTRPFTLWLGNDPRLLAAYVTDLEPVWRPGFAVWASGELELRGPLTPSGEIEAQRLEDFRDRWSDHRRALPGPDPSVLLWVEEQPRELGRVAEYLSRLDRVRELVRDVLAPRAEPPELRIDLHFDAAGYVRATGSRDLARVNPVVPMVRALIAPGMPDDGGSAAARASVLALLGGPPAAPWLLDGVGGGFAERWWGRPMESWVAFLHQAGLSLPVEELVHPLAHERYSPHRLVPLRGALLQTALAKRGPRAIARAWSGEQPLVPDEALEEAYRAALDALVERHAEALETRRSAAIDRTLRPGFRGGVVLVPRGPDLEGELLDPGLDASLARAAALGADAVSLVPLAFAEPRPRARPAERRPAVDATLGDLALAYAASSARRAGLGLMLAPQLVSTPSGTWTDAGLVSLEQTRDFFVEYEPFALHYALLAELLGSDVLCVGSDLRHVTWTDLPPDAPAEQRAVVEARVDGWRGLLGQVRRAYTGAITYAASTPGEIGGTSIWEHVDLVGAQIFPRLPDPRSPGGRARARDALEALLADSLAVARRFQRPLLVTEIGFPSNADAASETWSPRGPPDPEEQAMLYEALAEALTRVRAESRDLAGVFLFSWGPPPTSGGAHDPGHTPQGKPAERFVPVILDGGG